MSSEASQPNIELADLKQLSEYILIFFQVSFTSEQSDFTNKTMEEDKLNVIFKASGYPHLPMGEIKSCNEARKRQFQSIDSQNLLVEKPAQDIIKEIAILEMEVKNLEKYLLSKYRTTFEKTASSYISMDTMSKKTADTLDCNSTEHIVKDSSMLDSMSSAEIKNPANNSSGILRVQPLLDSSIQYRSHSSLSQSAACSYRISPPRATNAEAMHSFHSLPLSMLERAQDSSSVSLAEHLATVKSFDHVRETPNRLSEEMVKCITAIYCQLAEPPLLNHGFPTSPISFSSSMSESPPQVQYYDRRSPQHKENSSFSKWISNSFRVEDSNELSGTYSTSTMIEIHGICGDAWRLRGVEHMLQHFRSLVSQLEEVDPRKLKHEEKLAFWINVHNVLVMHVFLVNGIPRSNLKRTSLLLKASYDIGGHIISVDMIQSLILGCRLPRPGQWFKSLLFPKSKLKAGDPRKAYAIRRPQPLLKFALASGSYCDPMVRVYTPKKLFQELEMAKEEYIQTTCKIQNERKIFLPKIVDSYAKELGLCSASLFKMIEHSTSYYMLQRSFHHPHQENKLSKKIEWIPHNFTFRYLFAPELASK
ncbi:Cytochrome c biogenesis protein CCS1 [Heracleum sosnowskyi]|uniref:Cytochrome c biogenesis protein CCS1 n=1 Tax=Heracleum sosnowskyi TaxID=360622 RepID=A0AAD8H2Y3_9APIA|nr:Cytochrome c biogenesis protein CCS1 [Heracleum sosnowskyi]